MLSIAQFWDRAAGHGSTPGRFAVTGGGETAASMLNELFPASGLNVPSSPTQVAVHRGEDSSRTHCFSDPTDWAARRSTNGDALARTDEVFSATVQEARWPIPHPSSAWPGRPRR